MKGKKGLQATTGQILAVLIGVAIIVGMVMYLPQLVAKAEKPAVVPEEPTAGTTGSVELGKASIVATACYDGVADSATQIASELYMWQDGLLIEDQTSMAADTRTESDAVTGDDITAICFSSTYPYGMEEEFTVNAEVQNKNLVGYTGASTSDMQVKYFYDGEDVTSAGVTVGASEVVGLDKIRVKLNTNNKAFNLGAICFNASSSTNIDKITIKNLDSITVPERLDDTFDWCYSIPEQMLEEWDMFETGSVEIKAKSSNPAETVTIAVLDLAPYIKIDNSLGYGYEDDADSPSDVGIGDVIEDLVIN